jgi:hypothetical protein
MVSRKQHLLTTSHRKVPRMRIRDEPCEQIIPRAPADKPPRDTPRPPFIESFWGVLDQRHGTERRAKLPAHANGDVEHDPLRPGPMQSLGALVALLRSTKAAHISCSTSSRTRERKKNCCHPQWRGRVLPVASGELEVARHWPW